MQKHKINFTKFADTAPIQDVVDAINKRRAGNRSKNDTKYTKFEFKNAILHEYHPGPSKGGKY
jgi:hypothetical protein